MTVTATLHASTADEVAELGGRIHDSGLGIGHDARDDPGMLTGLAFVPEREAIRAFTCMGRD